MQQSAICQSCGRSIERPEDFGTDAKGLTSTDYCSLCFEGGRFIEPRVTVEEMVDRATIHLGRDMTPERARASALQLVPTLGRWVPGEQLRRRWWALLLRGLLAIAFGLVVLFFPGRSALLLLYVFGAWLFIDGVFALGHAFAGERHAWLFAIDGILGIAIGVMAFTRPAITAIALYLTIAVWSMIAGLVRIGMSISLWNRVRGPGWLLAGGIAAVAFGALLIALPQAGILAVLWLISLDALVIGVLLLGMAFRVRSAGKAVERVERFVGPPAPAQPQPV
jgi:uncharacterized membrane protein HdeD (DUF308 family)